jgi:hypothetical protein
LKEKVEKAQFHYNLREDAVIMKAYKILGLSTLSLFLVGCTSNFIFGSIDSNDVNEYLQFTLNDDNQSYCVGCPFDDYKGSIAIPSEYKGFPVTSISEYGFSGCGHLTSIDIPDSVICLGERAFEGCSSLTSINIPDGVTEISDGTFSGCSSLVSIDIPDNAVSIGQSAFSLCSSLTSIIIPEGVTSIGDYAFSGCSSLTSINIPDGVTKILECTFFGCSSLASIDISNNITSIGQNAFEDCSSLASIVIPEGVRSIGQNAFRYCHSLASINIPDGVTEISDGTFHDCSSLLFITLPDSITSIGQNAFEDCSSLASINIPKKVTSIGLNAFAGCYRLVEVINNSSLGIVANSDEYGKVASNAKNVITDGTPSKISIEDSFIFYDDTCLVNYFGDKKEITIPKGVTDINKYAFFGCSSLASITIPASVTSIGESAFSGCSSSLDIYYSGGSMYGWLTISGKSELTGNVHLYPDGENELVEAVIPDYFTSIEAYAFYNCSSLTTVTIPDGVSYVSGQAFCGCSSLTSIYVSNDNEFLRSIDGVLFSSRENPVNLICCPAGREGIYEIPSTVTEIKRYAFCGSALTLITIPFSVKCIDDYALYNCPSLTSIYFDGTMEEWNSIDLGKNWKYSTPLHVVHCTDGDVNL